MIFIALTPLVLCVFIFFLLRENKRDMEQYSQKLTEPYINASISNLDWHRNEYLKQSI